MFLLWVKRLLGLAPEPFEQLELPFYCGLWGESCDYSRDLCGGCFYNRCCRCGIRYEPVCDR